MQRSRLTTTHLWKAPPPSHAHQNEVMNTSLFAVNEPSPCSKNSVTLCCSPGRHPSLPNSQASGASMYQLRCLRAIPQRTSPLATRRASLLCCPPVSRAPFRRTRATGVLFCAQWPWWTTGARHQKPCLCSPETGASA